MAANQKANVSANTADTSLTSGGYVLTNTNGPTYTYIGGGGGGFGGGGNYATNSTIGIGTWSSQSAPATITAGTLELSGNKADVTINGVSLNETLKTIQERLNILVPNSKFEKEWDELKKLGEQYRKLEAELEEKSRMWTALKKTE